MDTTVLTQLAIALGLGLLAWRVIVLAVCANPVFKSGIAFVLSPPALRTRVGLWSAACVVAGVALLELWPAAV